MSAPLRLVCLALTLALFSGCAFPGGGAGKAFDAVDVPTWESGYKWTYDVISSSQASGFDKEGIGTDGDSQRASITMSVINTTKELDGEPLYVVSLDETTDHPLFEGNTQAFSQEDLRVAAVGFAHQYYGESGSSDPCFSYGPLQPVDADEQFPALRFPLDDGLEWDGSVGGDEPFMDYTMRVHGLVDVQVPAGTFKAVYVTTDFQPAEIPEEAREEIGMFDLQLRSEQWYSPDVRYLVKSVFSASA